MAELVFIDPLLKQLEESYCGTTFYRISRSTIINRKAIKHISVGVRKGTLLINTIDTLKVNAPDTSANDPLDVEILTVSEDHTEEFAKWFNME